jgi:replicative DNA helicase
VRHVANAIGQAATTKGVKFVVVDYLQLLRGHGQSRYEQITDVSMALKAAAVQYNVALVVLAQLSREVEKAEGYVPEMHHLKDSGQIEQDADVVFCLQWPLMHEAHNKQKKRRDDARVDPHEYRVFARKNRNRGIDPTTAFVRVWPQRMMLTDAHRYPPGQDPKKDANRIGAFDQYNDSSAGTEGF